jgi:hypothetical protein
MNRAFLPLQPAMTPSLRPALRQPRPIRPRPARGLGEDTGASALPQLVHALCCTACEFPRGRHHSPGPLHNGKTISPAPHARGVAARLRVTERRMLAVTRTSISPRLRISRCLARARALAVDARWIPREQTQLRAATWAGGHHLSGQLAGGR